MSYHRTSLGLDSDQQAALAVTPAELHALEPNLRAMLSIRSRELRAHERSAFWSMILALATAAAALGLARKR